MCEYVTPQHARSTPLLLRTQSNEFTSIEQWTENIQLLPMPTSNTHPSTPPTHRYVNLVSLPRASILPENLFLCRFLDADRAQHGHSYAHTNNIPAQSLCLRPQRNKCTRLLNQGREHAQWLPMRKNNARAHTYTHTHKPCSGSQIC